MPENIVSEPTSKYLIWRPSETLATIDSLNAATNWFFPGLTRVTGTKIVEEYRKEVYMYAADANLFELRLVI